MINIDTEKIKNCGKDIIKLSQDLNEMIESLYSRINNMPTVTKEWVGLSSVEYVKKANQEKIEAIELKNTLYAFGDAIVKSANMYDTTVNNLME